MPYDDPDPQDPNMLVGVPVDLNREAVREMAYAFAEEYSELGYDQEWLLRLFQEPTYTGPHRALTILGEEEIRSIVRESAGRWGHARIVVHEPEPPGAKDRLVTIGAGRVGGRVSTQSRQEGE